MYFLPVKKMKIFYCDDSLNNERAKEQLLYVTSDQLISDWLRNIRKLFLQSPIRTVLDFNHSLTTRALWQTVNWKKKVFLQDTVSAPNKLRPPTKGSATFCRKRFGFWKFDWKVICDWLQMLMFHALVINYYSELVGAYKSFDCRLTQAIHRYSNFALLPPWSILPAPCVRWHKRCAVAV